MPAIAYLECSRCHHKVSAETPQTVCPVDAGSLYVRYDMEALRRTARREEIAARAAAGTSLGTWRYASVLPEATPVTLGEGWTPMLRSRRYPGLQVKEEGANPTGAFEARGLGMAVTMAQHYGLRHLAMASAGDAAGALAAYAAAAGIAAHLFMPRDVAFTNYVEGVVYGSEVTLVEGAIPDCALRLGERVAEQKAAGMAAWFDVSTLREPFRVEGEKTLGYELVEQLGWEYPAAVLYPAGGGAGLMGMSKAFEEMEQLGWVSGRRPKMYALQMRGGGAISNAYEGHKVGGEGFAGADVEASGGRLMAVTEKEILESLLVWARCEGIFLSPEGAAAAVAYDRLLAAGELEAEDRVVLINAGAGLKYMDVTAKAMRLRRPGSLPTSLPVGGIITPV